MPRSNSRPAELAQRLLAALLGLGLGGAALEGGLWLLDLPRAGPFFQEYYGQGWKLMCYRERASGDADLELRDAATRDALADRLAETDFLSTWQRTPNCVEVRYNAEGFREREIGAKAPGVTRIGVIGDSFTYGHGLPANAPFPRRLEALLRERFGDGRHEVLNLGVGGIDLPGLVELGKRVLAQKELDFLLYAYFINDGAALPGLEPPPETNLALRAGWGDAEPGRGRLSLGVRPAGFPRSVRAIRQLLAQRDVSRATLRYYRWLHDAENWPKIARRIERLRAAAAARGSAFAVVPLPIPFRMGRDYPFAPLHARIVEDLASRGVRVVDVLPALTASEGELSLHPEDLHPNASYHERVAEVLLEELFPSE